MGVSCTGDLDSDSEEGESESLMMWMCLDCFEATCRALSGGVEHEIGLVGEIHLEVAVRVVPILLSCTGDFEPQPSLLGE